MNSMKLRPPLSFVLQAIPFCLFIFFAISCGEEKAPSSAGKEEVTLLLNWFPEMEHGGFYSALVEGFYDEAGLDVEIQRGGVDVPVIQLVGTGRVLFGIANADDVLIGRAQGADVVALMAPIQNSPRCILVRPDAGIDDFSELNNITLAMSSRAPFSHYLRSELPLNNVQITGYPGSVAPLVAGSIQAMQGYNFSEPYVVRQNGIEPVVLMVSDLGFNPYTSVLITRGEVLREHPDLVRRVVQASLRGWEHYINEPHSANQRIHELNPEMGMDILNFGAETLKEMVVTDEVQERGIGTMSAGRWQTLASQLEAIKLIEPGRVVPADAWSGDYF